MLPKSPTSSSRNSITATRCSGSWEQTSWSVLKEIGWQTGRSAATHEINLSTRGQSEDADRPRFGFLRAIELESQGRNINMIASNSPITPEQLLAMPDSESLEIVRGELVEKNVGFESSEIALILGALLVTYCRKHKLGRMGA